VSDRLATLAPAGADDPTVIADRLEVTYKVYADSQPKLRKLFVGDTSQRRFRAVEAVKRVSFVARPGEAIGIIGHNGSGKSTLLRAIAGLVPSTGGAVYASSIPVLLGVAAALEGDISGRRNIYLGGTALGMKRDELDERMESIIEFAGLEEFIDLPLRTYSSGMRSRLQFSIATAVTPEILMVDEALSTGDGEFKDRSDARIREMIGEAGTVFLVSHSLKSVTDVCTRTLWLDHGELIADGDPEEVVGAYQAHIETLKAANRARRLERDATEHARQDASRAGAAEQQPTGAD
jgi:teichoic acid transport system ATP-binding protein